MHYEIYLEIATLISVSHNVAIFLYLLRSYSSREPFSKSECANIVQATEKVEVALDSLVNGLKDSLSDKMC